MISSMSKLSSLWSPSELAHLVLQWSDKDFSESPTYGEKMVAADIDKKVAPAIEAIALTKVVLPQPGGP